VFVQRGFHLVPACAMLDPGPRFFVVTLDRETPRLLRAGPNGLADTGAPALGDALSEIRARTELPADVGFHPAGPAAGGRPAARHHAQGESPQDYEQVQLDQFARGVAAAVDAAMAAETAPLVPVGEPNLLGMFRSHCRYPDLTEDSVAKSPAGLDRGEILRAALAIADKQFPTPAATAVARFASRHNRGDSAASVRRDEILAAASTGRVATTLLARDSAGTGLTALARDTPEIQLLEIDRIIRETLLHGGDIVPVGPRDLPGEATIAALFRY
jgi:hypothetical protein